MSVSLRLGVVAALVSGAISLAAQAQRPTFKAGVDLVPVDVSVVDKDGRPVPDLTADDFVLSVDGRPRKVASAQFFSVPPATSDAPSTPPAYYSTNAGVAGGRLIVMVVDAGNISTARSKTALDAASRFVSHLSKADRIALVTLPSGGAQIDFTSNHALIQAAHPKIVGQSSAAVASRSFGIGGALAFERSDEGVIQQIVERQCGG